MMLVMGKAAPLLGTEVKRRGRDDDEGGKERDFVRKGRNGRSEKKNRAPRPPSSPPKERTAMRRGERRRRRSADGQDDRDRICEDETWAGGRVCVRK